MVFRTVSAIATALIGVSGQALAQYYPSHQAYPRQPLPPAVNADELPSLNAPAVQDHPLPPVGVGPAYQPLSGAPYEQGIAAPPADAVPATARWQPRLPTTRLWAGCSEPLRPAWRHSARPARFGQTGCNTGGGHTVAAEKQPRSSRFATNRNQADAKRRPG
jgi:hypothetical protein